MAMLHPYHGTGSPKNPEEIPRRSRSWLVCKHFRNGRRLFSSHDISGEIPTVTLTPPPLPPPSMTSTNLLVPPPGVWFDRQQDGWQNSRSGRNVQITTDTLTHTETHINVPVILERCFGIGGDVLRCVGSTSCALRRRSEIPQDSYKDAQRFFACDRETEEPSPNPISNT